MTSKTKAVVIIPTYWTWPSTESQRAATSAYDHPTPLDGQSTLPPLLEDLAKQRADRVQVLVLVGQAHPDMGEAAAAHARALLQPFRERLDLRLCDAAALARLRELLGIAGLHTELLHLESYAGIRNLQLLVPHILGAEVIVALDDDERVEPDYIERALKYVGKSIEGERVLGLAGPYLQRDGGVLLKEAPSAGNIFRDKARHINSAMRMLMAKSRGLTPSPMALGGNMVFHREVFMGVCFDPGITRGEDIDYLINARLQGVRWWFDSELTILHLPPRHHETPAYQRTREDVLRFIYEREKLRLHGEGRPDWLEPYPGAMLGEDLEYQALAALELEASPELVERLGDPQSIVEAARERARLNASRYTGFVDAWRELMRRLESDTSLRRASARVFTRL